MVVVCETNEDGSVDHKLARLTDWLQGLFLPRRRRCQHGVMRTFWNFNTAILHNGTNFEFSVWCDEIYTIFDLVAYTVTHGPGSAISTFCYHWICKVRSSICCSANEWPQCYTPLVTGTAIKPSLSGNMLSNMNTCKNGWSNFSENLRIIVLKFL